MTSNPDTFATTVVELQDKFTAGWHINPNASADDLDELLGLVLEQHGFNFDLWHEEDKAREPGVDDFIIAQVKRNIDGLNQQRNDTINQIDECLANTLFRNQNDNPDLPWNSETAGSIIDRLSIASLKLYHMREQLDRSDATAQHREDCARKVARLLEQQADLSTALQLFINEVIAGRKQNKIYHQFKMYNDPNLNPLIYKKRKP